MAKSVRFGSFGTPGGLITVDSVLGWSVMNGKLTVGDLADSDNDDFGCP